MVLSIRTLTKVCHISSVHPSKDPRIRLKQVESLSQNGFDVTFVTGDLNAAENGAARIVKVSPGNANRLMRMLVTSPRCIWEAAKLRADIYHIHDPELLPWAWFLLFLRKPVVYDVHEDYLTSVSQKRYIPRSLRALAGRIVAFSEVLLSAPFYKVIAEKYYARRFPTAVSILNYPQVDRLLSIRAFDATSIQLLYTGSVSEDRGAINMSKLADHHAEIRVSVVGRCSDDLAARMYAVADDGSARLKIDRNDGYVPFESIVATYSQGCWLAGLALFPDSPHYREKELTKFFEYMAVGLPIIASDFPVWKELIQDQGVGLCVAHGDMDAISAAIDWLRTNPRAAERMSMRGKELVKQKYRWDTQARKLINFYSELSRDRS